MYSIEVGSFGKVELHNVASYRTSTVPIGLAVSDNLIAVADLMKSISVVEASFSPELVMNDRMKEVARHFQTVWTTAVADIAENTYLISDAEGNLIVLRRNINGVTAEDQRRLEVTSEMLLGEMVNRIRPVNIPQTSSVVVTPKAFLGTVSLRDFFLINRIQPRRTYFFPLSQPSNSRGKKPTETTGRGLNLPFCTDQSQISGLLDAFPSRRGGLRRITRQHALQQIPRIP